MLRSSDVPITWRRANENDIEACLALQPGNRGDGLPDVKSAIAPWQRIFRDPFFLSVVVESDPPIHGHRLIGFGSAVLVDPLFIDAEIANPRPFIASRVIASLGTSRPALASRDIVARTNAHEGVNVIVLHNAWLDDLLEEGERHAVRVSLVSSFADVLAGYRVRRIVAEANGPASDVFHRGSAEFKLLAEFPAVQHAVLLMTRQSATALPGSMGNVIFQFSPPVLRLRESDQQLLLAAFSGATDEELAEKLGITFAAVKARWRSTFARIADVKPNLVNEADEKRTRGAQKRHRVLGYLRTHMEELRPYDWKREQQAFRQARA